MLGMFSNSCLAMSLQPDCRASAGISLSEYQSLSTLWAYEALGVAWFTRVVVTIPTDLPVISTRKDGGVRREGTVCLFEIRTFSRCDFGRLEVNLQNGTKDVDCFFLSSHRRRGRFMKAFH